MEPSLNEVPTKAMREEKKKLRRVFRRFDMVLYTMTAVIALNALVLFVWGQRESRKKVLYPVGEKRKKGKKES
jgi:cell division protein FtsL